MKKPIWNLIRVCLIVGAAIDLFVGLLSLFAPEAFGVLLDFPIKDTALATITGGELIVVALVYIFIFTNPRRYQPLFYVVALDQLFAALLPALEMLRGHIAVTWKTAGPIPLNVALCALFIYAARSKLFVERRGDSRQG